MDLLLFCAVNQGAVSIVDPSPVDGVDRPRGRLFGLKVPRRIAGAQNLDREDQPAHLHIVEAAAAVDHWIAKRQAATRS